MLSGKAEVAELAARACEMASFDAKAVTLAGVQVLQAVFEMDWAARQAVLPPGLHPTNPPIVTFLAWQVPDSPWGSFTMAQARAGCRSGVRPRGFVAGAVNDNPAAAAALAGGWGLPGVAGQVRLQRWYDAVELEVVVGTATALRLVASRPVPLRLGDVQYTVTTSLALTPRGLRLVQSEPEYAMDRVERVQPRLESFDPSAWGEPALAPTTPVAATVGTGAVTLPPLRYVSRPEVSAFEGTEPVR